MIYFNYLTEIKNRFICVIIACFLSSYVAYEYKEVLLFILIKPSTCFFEEQSLYFIYTNISELFYTYINLILTTTIQTNVVFFFFQMIQFLKPGLYKSESILIKKYFTVITTTWISTIFVVYKLIIPFSWDFFFAIQNQIKENQIEFFFEAKLNEYLLFVMSTFNICLLNLMLISLMSAYLYKIPNTLKYVKIYRKKIYFILFLLASVITPPDIFSQMLLGFISIGFLEIYLYMLIANKKLTEAN